MLNLYAAFASLYPDCCIGLETGRGLNSHLDKAAQQPWARCSQLCASVTKQCICHVTQPSLYSNIHGSHSLGYKKFQDFSRTFQDSSSIFPRPCGKPTIFKYNDKQQLVCLGQCWDNIESLLVHWLRKHFWHTCSPENVPDGTNYGYFCLQKPVYLKLKTAMHIIA